MDWVVMIMSQVPCQILEVVLRDMQLEKRDIFTVFAGLTCVDIHGGLSYPSSEGTCFAYSKPRMKIASQIRSHCPPTESSIGLPPGARICCPAGPRYSQNTKAYVVLNKHTLKVKESLNVTFDESPPPTKLSPLVDDDVGEEEAIGNNTKVVNNNNVEDELLEVDEVVNIKEFKNHPLEHVIGNLNQITLISQA
nr:retrotransposon protein [Tanacetum cinerariifolium]